MYLYIPFFINSRLGTQNKLKDDHVLTYSRAILFDGLRDLCRRDCVRENDGPAIVSDWRLYSPEFYSNNHFKYSILSHNLLAGI